MGRRETQEGKKRLGLRTRFQSPTPDSRLESALNRLWKSLWRRQLRDSLVKILSAFPLLQFICSRSTHSIPTLKNKHLNLVRERKVYTATQAVTPIRHTRQQKKVFATFLVFITGRSPRYIETTSSREKERDLKMSIGLTTSSVSD